MHINSGYISINLCFRGMSWQCCLIILDWFLIANKIYWEYGWAHKSGNKGLVPVRIEIRNDPLDCQRMHLQNRGFAEFFFLRIFRFVNAVFTGTFRVQLSMTAAERVHEMLLAIYLSKYILLKKWHLTSA